MVNDLEDEIRNYIVGRYISSSEAAWRSLGYSTYGMEPTVITVEVHTPGFLFFLSGQEHSSYILVNTGRNTMVFDPTALDQALESSLSKFSQLERYLFRPSHLKAPNSERKISLDNMSYRDYVEQVFSPYFKG